MLDNSYTTNQPTMPTSSKKPKKGVWLYLGMIILIIIIIGIGYFFYQKQQLIPTSESEAQELARVVKEVGKLMDLPDDETPVLATVTDKDKIKTQAFFARSENGDKVLLYTNFGRAILYRPSTNKIVDVTLVNTTSNTTSSSSNSDVEASPPISVTTTPTPNSTFSDTTKVAILNGTTTTGLASTAETKLLAAIPNLEIITKANATRQDYPITQVIVLSPTISETANQIARNYNTSVSSQLPNGELATGVDVVVILGSDAR